MNNDGLSERGEHITEIANLKRMLFLHVEALTITDPDSFTREVLEKACLVSIASSLARIADALEREELEK